MDDIIKKLLIFRDERNWQQFHTPENLAKSISIEAGELLECYQWSSKNSNNNKIKEELADVLIYCLYLAEYYRFDIKTIISEKILENAKKYPIPQSKNNSKKYTDF
ncbi:MAG: nucleotide pyrophosphohydrolase [Phascolarctobacterium sp.]|jgi:dCTP diphosphatase|uniref:nucleotide pyrophosphohydrolase n=1 Tax=Phascolarctobacterium sp. TaxID=2049039 RepID=UPI0025CDEB79|nr:nucleotide pyrophosphohydrolase [Phascolarctobacterium sp.]MCC8159458.1 nucleotide pyrophosphohydrolase [Phascolarctobacterium sp.]